MSRERRKKDCSLVCDDGYYLIIIVYDPEHDIWVVDEDSRHILEKAAGGYTVQEIKGQIIRPLTDSTMLPNNVKDDFGIEKLEEVQMKKKLTVEEINLKLQLATDEDMVGVVEDSGPYDLHANLEPDMDGWDEYVERVLKQDPPENLEEEEV